MPRVRNGDNSPLKKGAKLSFRRRVMNLSKMNLPELNFPDRKSWSAAASPSNLAMAALVGFLFVGQATDWKILFGRKSKASSTKSDPKSEVADRRSATREAQKSQRELD